MVLLIEQRCGVHLAVRTMGTCLARWNFTPQKPLRRAYEQDPDEVRRWVKKTYSAIQAKARRQKGRIFWGNETGLRSDDVRGCSYAPRGKTPMVRPCHKRANVGVISAVSNQRELRWMVLHGAITAPVLILFLQRLIRDAGCKVFPTLDRLIPTRLNEDSSTGSYLFDRNDVWCRPISRPLRGLV